jgi:excisionase family DNA binding protein
VSLQHLGNLLLQVKIANRFIPNNWSKFLSDMSEITGVILHVSMNDLKGLIADAVAEGNHSNRASQKAKEAQDEILNIQQASEFLNLAIPTIYGLTYNRKIPFFKPGKKLYFKRKELNEWRMRSSKPMLDQKNLVDKQILRGRRKDK